MALHILVLASLLMLANATTTDSSESTTMQFEFKERQKIPDQIKELQQNVTSHAELIQTMARALKDQCTAMERWKYQTRLMDNAADQNRGAIDIASATQKSTYEYGYASRTINDIRSSSYDHSGCSHTRDYDYYPWWQANLAYAATVELVRMMNRADSCGWRLNNFEIQGFDSNPAYAPKKICAKYRGTVREGVTETIQCDTPITAKYVRLYKYSQHIQLCTFEIEGTPILDKTMASAIQSSTHPTELNSRAWRALLMYTKACSQTDPEEDSDPWWQMKFQETTTVRSVKITNRNDANYTWLKNIAVTVYERQPTSCTGEEDGLSCTTYDDVVPKGGTVTLTCNPTRTGLYLRITKTRTVGEALSLCRVVVN